MRRVHPGSARRGGFTLVETMLALVILAIGLLGLSAMQLQAMQYGNRGRHSTQAASIAQGRLEQLMRARWTNLAPTGGWTAPTPANNIVQTSGNETEQAYNVTWRITDDVVGITRTIDVRVDWDEPDRPNRQFAMSSSRFNHEGL